MNEGEQWIAVRSLRGSGGEELEIGVGSPRRLSNDEWVCSYRILGLVDPVLGDAHGSDSLQALVLAIEGVGVALERTGAEFSWMTERGDHGVPRYIPQFLPPAFRGRVSEFIDAEVKRFCEEGKRRHREREDSGQGE